MPRGFCTLVLFHRHRHTHTHTHTNIVNIACALTVIYISQYAVQYHLYRFNSFTESNPPVNLHQNVFANTENLAMVQWQSPSSSIVNYTVTVKPPTSNCSANSTDTESYEKSNDVYIQNISIACYNKSYIVDVIATNYCDLSSVPVIIYVSIEARGKCNLYHEAL